MLLASFVAQIHVYLCTYPQKYWCVQNFMFRILLSMRFSALFFERFSRQGATEGFVR